MGLIEDLHAELEATQKALDLERCCRKHCESEMARFQDILLAVSRELSDGQYDYYEMPPEDCPRVLSAIHVIVLGEDE